jgi:predicted ArsR family transcriptional regulator
VLDVLREAGAPLDASSLARTLGLHVSTIRWHLRVLAATGLVTRDVEQRVRPGRPRAFYRPAAAALADADAPGLLAGILADSLARADADPARLVEEAGRARGRSLAGLRPLDRRPTGEGSTAELLALLAGLGFEPRLERHRSGACVLMQPCPFGHVASTHPLLVCPAHLGLMRGFLDAMAAPVDVERLEPFVEPDLCRARLAPRERRAAA